MDRFDDMAMFQVLARTGTISATAGELNVAPSAVSRRLKSLEERLHVQLVQRTTRRLTLTPAGEAYLAGARRILGEVENLEGGLQAGAGELSGRIRITAPASLGLVQLPNVLDKFMQEHPDVELDLHMTNERVDMVAEGFDLALRVGELGNSTLIARRLCRIDFAACVSPSFLAKHPNLVTPADLAGFPGCIYTGGSQKELLKWTAPDGTKGQVQLKPFVKANNGDILAALAARGHGVVCGPRFLVEAAIEAKQLIALFEGYRWSDTSLYVVYPQTAHISARLRALIDHFARSIKDLI